MIEHHVWCGISGIYAGTVDGAKTISKSLVTDEAIEAVANWTKYNQIEMHWVRKDPFTDSLYCSSCDYGVPTPELVTPYCGWCGKKATNFAEICNESEVEF